MDDQDTVRGGEKPKVLELEDGGSVVFDETTRELHLFTRGNADPVWKVPASAIPKIYDFLGNYLREPAGIR